MYFKVLLEMQEKDIYSELNSIRSLMERSTKFISLSGLSGIMAGIYAILGAALAYRIVYAEAALKYQDNSVPIETVWQLIFIAAAVLIFSVVTGIWLTIRQARKKGEKFWNPVSRRLLVNMAIPLVTGGSFAVTLILQGSYELVPAACLIFYGLALISGSHYTLSDVKWLGVFEIIIGLFAALFPVYGLLFCILGFGLLHILYGSIMHFKYKQ